MPPKGDGLKPEQIAALEAWVKSGAPWPAPPVSPPRRSAAPPVVDDAAFLRRVYLDTVGVPPTEAEARASSPTRPPNKRAKLIDRLLGRRPRFADHWMGYWQDVLAENPSILKPSLNNSGPFRWFLYDALRDGKPLDRLVTELVLLRGGAAEGGSAGFGMAADNDAPLAAKGQVLGRRVPRHRAAVRPLPRFALPQHQAARPLRAGRDARAQAGHGAEDQHGARRVLREEGRASR